jgi:hypothetical protein
VADRSQFLGRLASATQVIFAALIAVVASLHFEAGFVPRGAVLFAVFSLPGVVGLVGTMARRPSLLVAACAAATLGSFIAFSGVTLIFLIPALLFLAGAVRIEVAPALPAREGWLRGLAQAGIAAAIVVLIVGAGASSLLITDSGCWYRYETPLGVRIERAPYSTGISLPSGVSTAGCSTGQISARGAGLGVALGGVAVWLAFVGSRRRDRRAPDRQA